MKFLILTLIYTLIPLFFACNNDKNFNPLRYLHPDAHLRVGVYPVDEADIHDEVDNGEIAGHPNSFDIRAIKFEIYSPSYSKFTYTAWMNWERPSDVLSWMNPNKPSNLIGNHRWKSNPLQGFKIQLHFPDPNTILYYRSYVDREGWHNWVKSGETSGKTGHSFGIQAVQFAIVKCNRNAARQNKPPTTPFPPPLRPITTTISTTTTPPPSKKPLKYTFRVSYTFAAVDGVEIDHLLAINDEFPGPTITAELGDIAEITVINDIHDGQNTSFHWHGIHQKGTPWEDGPAMITQCPLKAGRSQLYRFKLDQVGTYWYHTHVKSQYTEGTWGALIVRDEKEPALYEYDGEFHISLSDWYHNSALKNEEWFLSPNHTGGPPSPHSGLMNGMGRFNCKFAINKTCLPSFQKRPVFKLERNNGKPLTYRVRLINTSGHTAYNFSIDGHLLQPIEIDGIQLSTGNRPVHSLTIDVGQRYSFVLHRFGKHFHNPEKRYLIRANIITEYLYDGPEENINLHYRELMSQVTGILEYVDDNENDKVGMSFELFDYTEKIPEPESTAGLHNPLDENALKLLDYSTFPAQASKIYFFQISFGTDAYGIRKGSFNSRPFKLPQDKPLLAKMVNGEKIPDHVVPILLNYMDVVDIVVNNPGPNHHPIHLHGHHFWVMKQGVWREGSYDADRHPLRNKPIMRDTTTVFGDSHLVLRFVADNPGVWTFHCLINWHNLSGMVATFIEGADIAWRTLHVPEETKRICRHHGITI